MFLTITGLLNAAAAQSQKLNGSFLTGTVLSRVFNQSYFMKFGENSKEVIILFSLNDE